MTDLNALFPADYNLFATMANKINERGKIAGMAIVLSGPDAGNIHSILLTPVNESIGRSVAEVVPTRPKSNVPANRNQLLQRFRLGPTRVIKAFVPLNGTPHGFFSIRLLAVLEGTWTA